MRHQEEPVKLSREVEATQIPYGDKVKLPAGSWVKITQALGDTFTVITEQGSMVRIEGKDADALGKKVPQAPQPPTAHPEDVPLEKLIVDQLKTCYDPEIPVNIYDLGLIYENRVTSFPEGGHRVDIKMTLTAPGCGMGTVLTQEVKSKVERLPGVKEVWVELVWEPHWDQSRMSDAAKLQLGML